MTNEEAIETIKTAIAEVEWEYPMDYAAAFDMAIEALKKQSKWIPDSEKLTDCIKKETLMKVSILGTDYEIIEQKKDENPKLEDKWAYTEPYSKKIIIDVEIGHEQSKDSSERQDLFAEKVLRHEIIHAFFTESGLIDNCDYAVNEELVDWIAIQFPKIAKVLEQLKGE